MIALFSAIGAFFGGFLPGPKLRRPTKEERRKLREQSTPTLKINVDPDGVMSWEILNPHPRYGVNKITVMQGWKPIGEIYAGKQVRLPRDA